MARIDDLITQLKDPKLQTELRDSLAELRKRQNFGIVFEEHIPETTDLRGFPIKPGMIVRRRPDLGGVQYRVERELANAKIEIRPIGSDEAPTTVRLSDLAAVKRFGDPLYPALRQASGSINRSGHKPFHSVINGENYNALQTLLYLHEGEVDCIYVDPPYNTGASYWKYNNRYVDPVDSWHHSKWLSFMEKRLKLSKRLLNRSGVLIVTIDEHEVHHLGMLLERLFAEYDRHMVTIVSNPKGTYKSNFARVDEYAFFCVPRQDRDPINPLPRGMFEGAKKPDDQIEIELDDEEELENLYLRRRGQESGFRTKRPNQFYALLVNEVTQEVVGVGPPLSLKDEYEVSKHGDIVTVYPLDTKNQERVWRYEPKRMARLIDKGEIVVTGHSQRTGQGWVLQHRRPRSPDKRLKTVWWEKRHDAGTHGSDLLTDLLGTADLFPFPKSVYAVRDCLNAVVRDRPEALIVDFFAGSGTTLHATCLLNSEDGGRRRSILVTNNEVDKRQTARLAKDGFFPGDDEYEANGVFWSVTAPRCRSVVTGQDPNGKPLPGAHLWSAGRALSEGFEENIAFFELEYLEPDEVDLGRQFDAILPMLWLAAGASGLRPEESSPGAWLLPEESNFAVLLEDTEFGPFRDALARRGDVRHVWLVTDSPHAFSQMRAMLPPELRVRMLYEDYLRTFRIGACQPG